MDPRRAMIGVRVNMGRRSGPLIQVLARLLLTAGHQDTPAERRTHDYKRHGTTPLFAALEGTTTARTRPRSSVAGSPVTGGSMRASRLPIPRGSGPRPHCP